jgi:hypothetical protein
MGQLPVHQGLYGKLVLGPRTELYLLRDDPSETKDLATANPTKVAELKQALDKFLADTNAVLPKQNPAFQPDNADWWQTGTAARE